MVAVKVSPLVALRHGGASLVDGVSVTKASANAKRSSGRESERKGASFGAGTAAVKRRTASIALFHGAVAAQTADGRTRTGRERHRPDTRGHV